MSVNTVLQDNRRRIFNLAKDLLETQVDGKQQYVVNNVAKAEKMGLPCMRLSQSKIISIIPINVNTTTYKLNVLTTEPNQGNNAGILPMEKRITMQDVLFTDSFGLFLCALNIGGAAGYTATEFQFQTFPSPSYQGLFGIGDASQLMGIWTAGWMTYDIGGVKIVPQWWVGDHLNINQTMTNISNVPPNPMWDQQSPSDGYQVTDPSWIINGGNNNNFEVKYNSEWAKVLGLANAATTVQFALVGIWSGWFAQNASSIMNNVARYK